MSDNHSVTKEQFRALLQEYHPQVVEVRERFDGEWYERVVYPHGSPPVVCGTFVLYSDSGQFCHFALVEGTAGLKYMNGEQVILTVTGQSPIGRAYLQCQSTDVFNVESDWYIVVSRNGESIPAEELCVERLRTRKKQVLESQEKAEQQQREWERQENLSRALSEQSVRLTQYETCLQAWTELEKHKADIQYVQDANRFLAMQTVYDLADMENLVKELSAYEITHLQPMHEEYERLQRTQAERRQRQLTYAKEVEERLDRLWNDEICLAEFRQLENYRIYLLQEWQTQLYLEQQELRHIDQLEPELLEANKCEFAHLNSMREKAQRLRMEAQEQELQQNQDQERHSPDYDNPIVEQLRQKREQQDKQQRPWQQADVQLQAGLHERQRAQSAQLQSDVAKQREKQQTQSIAYQEARETFDTIRYGVTISKTLSIPSAVASANTLRSLCAMNRDKAPPSTASATSANKDAGMARSLELLLAAS